MHGKSINFTNFPTNLWRIEDLFSQFGESITSLNLSYYRALGPIVMGFISEYCPNIIEFIGMIYRNSDIELLHELRAFIPKVEIFNVHIRSEHIHFDKLFDSSVDYYRMTSLTVKGANVVLPKVKLENLIELNVNQIGSRNNQSTERFYQLNSQLQKLSLNYAYYGLDIGKIVQHLRDLNELKMEMSLEDYDQIDLLCFGQLEKLKVLHIGETSKSLNALESISIILRALHTGGVPLENLFLVYIHPSSDVINDICQLKSIVKLHIGQLNDESSIRVVKCLHNMKHIQITTECMTFEGVRDMLAVASINLTKATIIVRIPKIRNLSVIDGRVFDDIGTMQSNRNIDLEMVYILMDRKMDDHPICEVSGRGFSFDGFFDRFFDFTLN